ncbi:MAG: cyclic nucleotide-binding domain-containing protein [Rhizobiales bacterium]|nr:cyclic nucleotide-binding domain-containing protein [Hyphomicrobiales bacterium]
MSVRADAETLRGIPIFAECDPVHLQLIAFASERQQFKAGEALIVQGQAGTYSFLILNGDADLIVERNGHEDFLGTAGPGAFLGEVAMIGSVPYSVTARARTALSAARISRNLFMRVAEEYPDFGKAVFRALGGKLDGSISDLLSAQVLLDRAKSFTSL